jgi:hypothetical protein
MRVEKLLCAFGLAGESRPEIWLRHTPIGYTPHALPS